MKKIILGALLVFALVVIISDDALADPPSNWRRVPPPTSWCVYAPEKGECFRQFSCGVTRFMYACGVAKCNSYADSVCDDGKSTTFDWCQNPGLKATCASSTQAACQYSTCPAFTHDANDDPTDGCEAQLFDYRVEYNQTSSTILAGDPASALVTITRTDVGGNPAEVVLTPSVVPGGISESTVIVEYLDPVTFTPKDRCTPNPTCQILARFRTSFDFAQPGSTVYTIDATANGADKSHNMVTPFTLNVVGCDFDNICEPPEREAQCPFDCSVDFDPTGSGGDDPDVSTVSCSKTNAKLRGTSISQAYTGRGGHPIFDVDVDITNCAPETYARNVQVYLKKLPPKNWNYRFTPEGCVNCRCQDDDCRVMVIDNAQGISSVGLEFDVPGNANQGRYNLKIGVKEIDDDD